MVKSAMNLEQLVYVRNRNILCDCDVVPDASGSGTGHVRCAATNKVLLFIAHRLRSANASLCIKIFLRILSRKIFAHKSQSYKLYIQKVQQ